MMSFNAVDENNDIEDGSGGLTMLELTKQGLLADNPINHDEEGPTDPEFHNVSVFLDENPMKKEAVTDRRPSSSGIAQLGKQHYSVAEGFMQFFGLAHSPLDLARREKYREMLEEMRATGPLKGNRAIDTAVANPKFLKMLE
eukprot:gene13487-14835_t